MVAKKPPRTTTPAPTPAPKPTPAPALKRASKAKGKLPSAEPPGDPSTDAALLALSPRYAESPDIPVHIAVEEIASLVRLARSQQARLTAVGVGPEQIDSLARVGRRLDALEAEWGSARGKVKITAAQKKLRDEAEKLRSKLVAGGRWALRKDEEAQGELTRISEGSGLLDTIQDLRDLVVFWGVHPDRLGSTDITSKDLARAAHLADVLAAAAAIEAASVDAARAIDLRNRAFWAGNDLAREIREGGRYTFREEPRVAAKFISSYRNEATRRSRQKSQPAAPDAPST